MSTFGARDLALLLPDEVDTSALRHTITGEVLEEFKPLQPKNDKSRKVQRYRPGQVPDYVREAEEDQESSNKDSRPSASTARQGRKIEIAKNIQIGRSRDSGRRVVEAEVIKARAKEDSDYDDDVDRRRARAKQRQSSSYVEAEVVRKDDLPEMPSSPEIVQDEDSDEEDEDQIAARRALLRARLKEKEEREELERAEESAGELPIESEESSEWETDTDASDSDNDEQLLKPVFVPKSARNTILNIKIEAEKEEQLEKKRLEKLAERRKETLQLVAETIQKEEEGPEVGDVQDKLGMPDDTDGNEPQEEFEQWKVRELRRVIRERDEKAAREAEQKEIERRRNMTAEEREAEDRLLEKNKPKEKKKKMKFLQKYYHKGAFYMDDDSVRTTNDVRKRDYSEPTLEDHIVKEALPTVMQVKNFGRMGQTKWTHLKNEDTTKFDAMWYQNDRLAQKSTKRMAGMKDIDDSRRKKSKS